MLVLLLWKRTGSGSIASGCCEECARANALKVHVVRQARLLQTRLAGIRAAGRAGWRRRSLSRQRFRPAWWDVILAMCRLLL